MTPRLLTIPWSHYCEKARWGLERAGIAYEERGHLPIFHYLPVILARRDISVPTLETADGTLGDSTHILEWIARRPSGAWLYPENARAEIAKLEDRFDEELGPATRRLAYGHVLTDPSLLERMDLALIPAHERRLGPRVFPAAAAYLRWRLKMSPERTELDRKAVFALLDDVAARLSDGRRFLAGDAFSAADLTFASLLAPLLLPDACAAYMPRFDAVSAPYRAEIERFRTHPAGAFALRLFREERRTVARAA